MEQRSLASSVSCRGHKPFPLFHLPSRRPATYLAQVLYKTNMRRI